MAEIVQLGEISCPSGELVVMDGGYLGLWSGDRTPEGFQPAVDFEIVGPDAEAAGRSFDRQWGSTLYDIPAGDAGAFGTLFDDSCREHGHDASLRRLDPQVPHRERARRAVAGATPGFIIWGVPVVVVGGVPADRRLPVTAERDDEWGWRYIRIQMGDGQVAQRRELDRIGVDNARFVFADADALGSWVHEDAIDGRADVLFWGRDEEELAAELGAPRVGAEGFGWLDLPADEAHRRALALEERRNSSTTHRFAFDFRPHSHHWQVMAGVRGSEHEAATVHVGGADIMFAMTSVGDGFFPAHAELDAAGALVAVQLSVASD